MTLQAAASRLAQALGKHNTRIVLAESCTGGLATAALAEVAGISNYLCGAAVVYREVTKQQWLEVSADDIAQYTAESDPVARQMAIGVLQRTSEADVAVSITGHLGPAAPRDVDGIVYIGLARRNLGNVECCSVSRHTLTQTDRGARQREAAILLLESAMNFVNAPH